MAVSASGRCRPRHLVGWSRRRLGDGAHDGFARGQQASAAAQQPQPVLRRGAAWPWRRPSRARARRPGAARPLLLGGAITASSLARACRRYRGGSTASEGMRGMGRSLRVPGTVRQRRRRRRGWWRRRPGRGGPAADRSGSGGRISLLGIAPRQATRGAGAARKRSRRRARPGRTAPRGSRRAPPRAACQAHPDRRHRRRAARPAARRDAGGAPPLARGGGHRDRDRRPGHPRGGRRRHSRARRSADHADDRQRPPRSRRRGLRTAAAPGRRAEGRHFGKGKAAPRDAAADSAHEPAHLALKPDGAARPRPRSYRATFGRRDARCGVGRSSTSRSSPAGEARARATMPMRGPGSSLAIGPACRARSPPS